MTFSKSNSPVPSVGADSFTVYARHVSALSDAVRHRRYPAFYRQLRQLERPLLADDAIALCGSVIVNDLTPRALDALLDHCPPVREMECAAGTSYMDTDSLKPEPGLVDFAVIHNNSRLLGVLLRRGFDPNGNPKMKASPLENALDHSLWQCAGRLLRQPSLKPDLTPGLLTIWSSYEEGLSDDAFRRALRAIAARLPRRLFYPSKQCYGVPLPRLLTISHAIGNYNFQLFCKLCDLGAVPDRTQAEHMLTLLHLRHLHDFDCIKRHKAKAGSGTEQPAGSHNPREDEGPAPPRTCFAPRALLLLLQHHPTLLRTNRTRGLLVYDYLMSKPQERGARLDPWIEKLKNSTVPIFSAYPFQSEEAEEGLLRFLGRWKEMLPDGPAPSVDPQLCIPAALHITSPEWNRKSPAERAKILAPLLEACVIVRKRKPAAPVSPLAAEVLGSLAPHIIQKQLEPGGLLWGEDPKQLLCLCAGAVKPQIPAANRAVPAAFLKSEERYAL